MQNQAKNEAGPKIAKLSTQIKLNWNKFDTSLTGSLKEEKVVKGLI
jgi:hypothetical protein